MGYETVMDPAFSQRREALMARIGPRAVAIIHGTHAARRNSDVEHRYRAPSDLLYLTGLTEPESFAVLTPGRAERLTLFVRPRDPDKEVWTGRRLGLEGALGTLGADRAHPIEELPARLLDLCDGCDEVHYLPGDERSVDELVLGTVAALRAGERRGRRAPTRIVDLRATLHELRLIKDDAGLLALRRAVAIAAEAHREAMRSARPGMREYEVEALVDYTFRRRGASGPGYGTICGGGDNATILHYVDNNDTLRAGELLLIDAGAEVDGFTSDVTRTFPPGGRFSPAQRRVYQLVLDTEKACIAMVRPGADIEQIHAHAVERLTAGLVELGLLSGFPGNAPRPLAAGMVLTVEPGLYIPASAADVPAELRGIGVRIEDDVLCTASGHEVLTADVPREIADIEALTAA